MVALIASRSDWLTEIYFYCQAFTAVNISRAPQGFALVCWREKLDNERLTTVWDKWSLKVLIFKRWRQLWMKKTTIYINQRCRVSLFFAVFRPFVFLPNTMSKLIYNRCTCKLIIKTTAAYVHADEQSRLCFYVLVFYFLVLEIHLWKLLTITIIRLKLS